ncbi:MAG: FAD:protein FMN transferase [Bacteroidota bacterium]
MKNVLIFFNSYPTNYRPVLLGISFILLLACQPQTKSGSTSEEVFVPYQTIQGQTMGTIGYNITYAGRANYKEEVDSILKEINNEVSTYVPSSSISRFNQSKDGIEVENINQRHFLKNISIAKDAAMKTNGSFDPTVMPLVNYWGFGYTGKEAVTLVDSIKVDSLLQYIGMNKISIGKKRINKKSAGIQLDFSASAKGYAIDELGYFLEQKGIFDYKVEIGGEVRTRGKNPNGIFWRLGINTPKEETSVNDLFAAIQLDNQSIATSGNYRNYYTVAGVTYSHTINPNTGLPERTNLLSASIITEDCAYADAYATACMVMGLEQAKEWVNTMEDVEAYFIFSGENNELQTYATEGIAASIERF